MADGGLRSSVVPAPRAAPAPRTGGGAGDPGREPWSAMRRPRAAVAELPERSAGAGRAVPDPVSDAERRAAGTGRLPAGTASGRPSLLVASGDVGGAPGPSPSPLGPPRAPGGARRPG